MKHLIIGCGGVGSWLTPAICRLADPQQVILIDGDKLEKKNLDRQLFNETHIGRYKAEALAELYGCRGIAKWFAMGDFEIDRDDFLLVGVDNHPARLDALHECDVNGCTAIFGANETYSAEAYLYRREWRGTALDPRVYYPDIAKDHSGDPRAASIGCTGEAQQQNRQLAGDNFMAAALMLQLFTLHTQVLATLKGEAREHLPYKLVSNMTRFETSKIKDGLKERTTNE